MHPDTLASRPLASAASAPEISVVVIVLQGEPALARCLTALAGQSGVPHIEIIVPYDDHHRDVLALQARFPDVHYLPVAGTRTYAELRAAGVRRARGPVVALTEDHCMPRPDWCAEILRAHAGPYAAVGGAVEKMAPDTALNWALYLADYVRYANPVPEGYVHHLTDCNVSYKRAALDPIADVWRQEFHEPEVHAALEGQGQTLWLSPHVVLDQQRSIRLLDAIRDRYAFGRLFGGRRVEQLSGPKRFLYAGTAILLPILLILRVAGHVRRTRRYTGAFVRALPFVTLLSTVWAWGEFAGYLTGQAEASLTPEHHPATA